MNYRSVWNSEERAGLVIHILVIVEVQDGILGRLDREQGDQISKWY